jgi:HK97 family phage prohead protease
MQTTSSYRAEVKAVSPSARIITGYASTFHEVPDRVGDIVDAKAFNRTLKEKALNQIGCFIAHDVSKLPVGVCVKAVADSTGLYTETKIKPTAEGDELLGTAQFLLDQGSPLGMSIGFQCRDYRHERLEGKTIRRLTDVDLLEYSFAAAPVIANPYALVSGVKTRRSWPESLAEAKALVADLRLSADWASWDPAGDEANPIAPYRRQIDRIKRDARDLGVDVDGDAARSVAWIGWLRTDARRHGVGV